MAERLPTSVAPEGDNYISGVPLRSWVNDEGHLPGQRMKLQGLVLDTAGEPITHMGIEFWQADHDGRYYGIPHFDLRGRQGTMYSGAFHLDTIVPGSHQERAPHIHVRVYNRGGTILTTEVFFPHNPENDRDPAFDPSRVVTIDERSDGLMLARFDFILPGS